MPRKIKNHTIQPFLEFDKLPGAEKLLTAYGFETTALHADITKEGWVRVYVTWKAAKDEYKFRRPTHVGTTFAWSDKSFNFEFPLVYRTHAMRHQLGFKVGLYNLRGRKVSYTPKFVEYLKYGMLCWFAPRNWNTGTKDTEIFKWESPD